MGASLLLWRLWLLKGEAHTLPASGECVVVHVFSIYSPGRTPTPRNRVFYARVRAATKFFSKKTRFLDPHA